MILDVVYNHTAEGNQLGPTLSFRGMVVDHIQNHLNALGVKSFYHGFEVIYFTGRRVACVRCEESYGVVSPIIA